MRTTSFQCKFVTEPTVYPVSFPSFSQSDVLQYMDDSGIALRASSGENESPLLTAHNEGRIDEKNHPDGAVEVATRLCYDSFGRGRSDYNSFINNVIVQGHTSVLEHANYGFLFTGVSRSLTHELVRHRAGFSYSQESQRYVEPRPLFVIPPAIRGNSYLEFTFKQMCEGAWQSYQSLLCAFQSKNSGIEYAPNTSARDKRKILRQTARSVLPNAIETRIYVTANLRAWRHFIDLRGSLDADAEIRGLAVKVYEALSKLAPAYLNDATLYYDGNGNSVELGHYENMD